MVFTATKRGYNRSGKGVLILRHFLLIIFALSFLIRPVTAWAQDITVVKAEGVAGKAEDAAEVKRKAIDRALKGAVTEALSELAKKEGIADISQIVDEALSSPLSYVQNYKVLSEGWITHMEPIPVPDSAPDDPRFIPQTGVELFHIWIEASVDNEALRSALSSAAQAGGTYSVTLNILDVTDYNAFRGLISSLERIALIKEISYNSFYRGRATLTAKASAGNSVLAERIAKEVSDGFVVILSGQAITIRPAPKNLE